MNNRLFNFWHWLTRSPWRQVTITRRTTISKELADRVSAELDSDYEFVLKHGQYTLRKKKK